MLAKGIISNISADGKHAEAILPEYDNAVTAMLPLANSIIDPVVGYKCVVALFSVSLADGAIIAVY